LLEKFEGPVILLGHAFPAEPIFGLRYEPGNEPGARQFEVAEDFDLPIPSGALFPAKGFGRIVPPPQATIYATRSVGTAHVSPFFSIGKNLVCAVRLKTLLDYSAIIGWWLSHMR
jgi:hypothetical protein